MRRPKTVWLLIAYFASCVVGAGLVLVGYENNNEYQMFRAAGLESLYVFLVERGNAAGHLDAEPVGDPCGDHDDHRDVGLRGAHDLGRVVESGGISRCAYRRTGGTWPSRACNDRVRAGDVPHDAGCQRHCHLGACGARRVVVPVEPSLLRGHEPAVGSLAVRLPAWERHTKVSARTRQSRRGRTRRTGSRRSNPRPWPSARSQSAAEAREKIRLLSRPRVRTRGATPAWARADRPRRRSDRVWDRAAR
jgi:hypothetical protein